MIQRRDPFDERLLEQLEETEEELPYRLRVELLAYGEAALRPLVSVLECGGWPAVHALNMIRSIGAGPVLGELVEELQFGEPYHWHYQAIVETLIDAGEPAIDALLDAWAATEDDQARLSLASALSRTDGRRADVSEVLARTLDIDLCFGCRVIGDYGDPAALPALSDAFDSLPLVEPDGSPVPARKFWDLGWAIDRLGGQRTAAQRQKMNDAAAHREAWERRQRALANAPIVAPARPGRNEPCWCGSGKKYKRCHQSEDELAPAR